MAHKTSLINRSLLKSIKDAGLSGLGNLIKLLPTGSVFMFHFLNPLLSNNGDCESEYKLPIQVFISICGLSCFVSTFTDSYMDLEGSVHYGIATPTGLWPSGDGSVDLSKYKLQISDFVHAFLSLGVYLVVTLLDFETMRCFYQNFVKDEEDMVKILPAIAGIVSGTVFTMFPIKRHGIGYPFDGNNYEASSKMES
ncbi:hypothetical protein SAY87_016706 [Trapa incisa]|uniref:Uncharacterized protein n=2 Tax=Trapa TaxID=22665 RepID=A0AAN7LTR8_TRANT|nr:hypothetical protein SAY87_016706 [Trapa incisa]KAK4791619.1 hypothetical protein SAY86_032032 [Trapa natans]